MEFTDEIGDTDDPWFKALANKLRDLGFTIWEDSDKLFASKSIPYENEPTVEEILAWIRKTIKEFEEAKP